MEICCEGDVQNSSIQFYNRMKKVVVSIETQLKPSYINFSIQSKYPIKQKEDILHGGGVLVSKEGLVLTVSRLVPDDVAAITFRHEDKVWSAKLVLVNKEFDLALLEVVNPEGAVFDFAKFGQDDSVCVGMQVFSISHPHDLYYSYTVGQVCFPCKQGSDSPQSQNPSPCCSYPNWRKVDVLLEGQKLSNEDDVLSNLNHNLSVIQINNQHGGTGSYGAPIFDSLGRVIGLSSFVLHGFDFAIHVSVLRLFCEIKFLEKERKLDKGRPEKKEMPSSAPELAGKSELNDPLLSTAMEICCEGQFLENDARINSIKFYNRMKKVVVFIETRLKPSELNDTCQPKYPEDPIWDCALGGGVLLSQEGLILTVAHIVPPDAVQITFRCEHEDEFWTAELVYERREFDLVILKVIEKGEFNFAKFGQDDSVRVGMEVFSISHPQDLYFSFNVGQVCFPCEQDSPQSQSPSPMSWTSNWRKVGEIIDREIDTEFSDYDDKLFVIQINNFHGRMGSSGAPVFDSLGRVIGLNCFILKGFDFAVHLNLLRSFWEAYLASGSKQVMAPKSKKRTKKRKLDMDLQGGKKMG